MMLSAAALIATLAVATTAIAAPGTTERVSVASDAGAHSLYLSMKPSCGMHNFQVRAIAEDRDLAPTSRNFTVVNQKKRG